MSFKLVKTFTNLTDEANQANISPDNKWCAVGSKDDNVYIFNLADLNLQTTLTNASASVSKNRFNWDSSRLVTYESGPWSGGPYGIYSYNTSTWSLSDSLNLGSSNAPYAMDFTPDSTEVIVTGTFREFRRYEIDNLSTINQNISDYNTGTIYKKDLSKVVTAYAYTGTQTLYEYDTSTWSRTTFASGDTDNVVYDNTGDYLLVHFASGTVSIYETATHTVDASISRVGVNPLDCGLDTINNEFVIVWDDGVLKKYDMSGTETYSESGFSTSGIYIDNGFYSPYFLIRDGTEVFVYKGNSRVITLEPDNVNDVDTSAISDDGRFIILTSKITYHVFVYENFVPKKYSIFDDCISYYDFRNDAKDLIGSNDGTVTNAVLIINHLGQVNSAYSFDGSGDYIDMGSTTNLVPSGNNLTLFCWVNINPSASNSAQICGKGSSSSWADIRYRLVFADNNTFRFGVGNTSGTTHEVSSGTITKGQWYFLTGVFDGSNVQLYLDGEYVTQTAWSGTFPTTNNNFVVGKASNAAEQYLYGQVTDVGFLNSALSADEVLELYNLTKNNNITPIIRGVKK